MSGDKEAFAALIFQLGVESMAADGQLRLSREEGRYLVEWTPKGGERTFSDRDSNLMAAVAGVARAHMEATPGSPRWKP